MTPLMRQYWDIKKNHSDQILFFRMGDFYEMFHDDAVIAAPILNIALTSRNKKSQDETPMCGMPHHSISGPIGKLLTAGHKVAICDQLEDPAMAKGIVKRGVTRILSPGMVYDPDTLDELKANYVASFDSQSVSFLDASTGEAFIYDYRDASDLAALLELLQPTEVVLSSTQRNEESAVIPPRAHLTVSDAVETNWPDRFKGISESALRLLSYASRMQGVEIISTLKDFQKRGRDGRMHMSPTVMNHLELLTNYRGELKGSLIHSIQRTKTSAGARRLRQWIQFPLTEKNEIEMRLDRVEKWFRNPTDLKILRKTLQGLGDIERRLSKMAYTSCHPRDLLALANSLEVGLLVSPHCPSLVPEDISSGHLVKNLVANAISSEPPAQLKNGGYILRGYNSDLDEYIDLAENSQNKLHDMEIRERDATGISSLKVRYNSVFGYYIEVTHTHKDKIPEHYKRKQTLTNAERYVTHELEELEQKVLSARAKRAELEDKIFKNIRREIINQSRSLLRLSDAWSDLDVAASLAWLALEYNYCRPILVENGEVILKSSRHPVIEQEVQKTFIPNDIHLQRGQCMLLTGPNMAGKSTLMRQVAMSCLLAQMGSFVPAASAQIPIYNRIFTRIGASDLLSEGLSTFMVEMKEAAELLAAADEKSLVVLDEIGRGTSTFDGMSLAQAILEHLVSISKSTTLFATHYHELTQLEKKFEKLENFHMEIEEKGRDIRFTYILSPGPANRSYGIHVGRLAGLPKSVIERAAHILSTHELGSGTIQMDQLSLQTQFELLPSADVWGDQIRKLNLNTMTPMDVLNTIYKWQQELS